MTVSPSLSLSYRVTRKHHESDSEPGPGAWACCPASEPRLSEPRSTLAPGPGADSVSPTGQALPGRPRALPGQLRPPQPGPGHLNSESVAGRAARNPPARRRGPRLPGPRMIQQRLRSVPATLTRTQPRARSLMIIPAESTTVTVQLELNLSARPRPCLSGRTLLNRLNPGEPIAFRL